MEESEQGLQSIQNPKSYTKIQNLQNKIFTRNNNRKRDNDYKKSRRVISSHMRVNCVSGKFRKLICNSLTRLLILYKRSMDRVICSGYWYMKQIFAPNTSNIENFIF